MCLGYCIHSRYTCIVQSRYMQLYLVSQVQLAVHASKQIPSTSAPHFSFISYTDIYQLNSVVRAAVECKPSHIPMHPPALLQSETGKFCMNIFSSVVGLQLGKSSLHTPNAWPSLSSVSLPPCQMTRFWVVAYNIPLFQIPAVCITRI